MSTILPIAQALVSQLIGLMPTHYQQVSLQALLGLFLEATGSPLPQGKPLQISKCIERSRSRSASGRFLNQYQWSTRKVIRTVRSAVIQQILAQPKTGRKPTLQAIIDLTTLEKRGQQVRLVGLKFPVSISWYYLKRDDGKLEKRFVLSTKALKGCTITWWGKRRWQIEGWFKTVKHRFGQGTRLGVYRWLVLSLIAYLLAHWAYLSTASTDLPDWGASARLALELLLPQLVVLLLLLEIQRLQPLAQTLGVDILFTCCKI